MKYYTNIHVPWAQLYHLNYHFEEGTQPIGYMTFTFLRDGFIRVEPFLRKTYYNTETYTSFIQAICHFADRFVGKGTLCVQRPFRKQSRFCAPKI